MRTKAFKYAGLALMAVLAISLTSCEVELGRFYDDDRNGVAYADRSADLCSRTWVSFYRDVDGNYCRQELDFFLNRTGMDYIRVEYPNGYVEEREYKFYWNWDNAGQTTIRMSYGSNDVSYFDDVYIGGNRLNGYLDGNNNYVEFQGK